jgi:hypothetical protein
MRSGAQRIAKGHQPILPGFPVRHAAVVDMQDDLEEVEVLYNSDLSRVTRVRFEGLKIINEEEE